MYAKGDIDVRTGVIINSSTTFKNMGMTRIAAQGKVAEYMVQNLWCILRNTPTWTVGGGPASGKRRLYWSVNHPKAVDVPENDEQKNFIDILVDHDSAIGEYIVFFNGHDVPRPELAFPITLPSEFNELFLDSEAGLTIVFASAAGDVGGVTDAGVGGIEVEFIGDLVRVK